MFCGTTAPYPRQDEVGADEDGIGFALRMATLNGITFNELSRRLTSPGHLYLPADASGAIAYMFGCTPTKLRHAFVDRYFRGEAHGAHYLGHKFLRPYHLRQTRPQVCPACIRRHLSALAAWSICLVTSCPTHGIRLLDRCKCGRPVSWRRPSVDLCECGSRLTDTDQSIEPADSRELVVSSQAMYLLGPDHFRLRPSDANLSAFDAITIDTFLRLIWIFGIIDGNSNVVRPESANRFLPTPEASAVCCRAYDRIVRLVETRAKCIDVAVHPSALEALRLDCTYPADIQLVESLCARLSSSVLRPRRIRVPRIGLQLPLFGDLND